MTDTIRLSLLGGFQLLDAAGRDIPVSNRKLCALIAYIALAGNGRETRERLAGLLWSETPIDRANGSLRQTLRRMRTVFSNCGFENFDISREHISLEMVCVNTDVQVAFDDIQALGCTMARIPSSEPSGTLLYGFENIDPAFEAWLHVERQSWTDKFSDVLAELLGGAGAVSSQHAASAMLKIDPSHEGAHRALMKSHAQNGNIGSALKQYEELWNFLDHEYGMEPSEETQELIVQIKSGEIASARSTEVVEVSSVPAKPWQPPSILVATFLEGGPSTDEPYLVAGFRRELIAALVRFREWRIVDWSRDAAMAEQPDQSNVPSYILEGSYYSHESALRVVITLKEYFSQRFIWSEQIELRIDHWFEAQSEIVRKIATALNVYISIERLSVIGQSSIGADLYSEWLHGQDMTLRWRKEPHTQARQIFENIISRAPDFGRAYSSLVQIENAAPLVQPGFLRSNETRKNSVGWARKAVSIDPLDSRAQLCLAWALAIDGRFGPAELNLEAATSLNGNDPWTIVSAALGWAFCGQKNRARELSDQAMSLDLSPSPSHWAYRATLEFLCGDYRECLDDIDRAEEALINLPAWRAAACHHLGHRKEANRSIQRFLELAERAWSIDTAPDEKAISRWLLQCFPIADPDVEREFREGLIGAGLPAP